MSDNELRFADAFNADAWTNQFENAQALSPNAGKIYGLNDTVINCPELSRFIIAEELITVARATARYATKGDLNAYLLKIDEDNMIAAQRRAGFITLKIQEKNTSNDETMKNAPTNVNKFTSILNDAVFYLEGKKDVGKKVRDVMYQGKLGDELKENFRAAGFKKKTLLGLRTKDEIATELATFVDLITAVSTNYLRPVFSEVFIGMAYLLEKNFDDANVHFDFARNSVHFWIQYVDKSQT